MGFLAYCLASVIRLVSVTWRIEIDRHAVAHGNENVVYAFRHGDLLALAALHRGQGLHVMVSQSRDGEFAAAVLECLGYRTIRGSSSKGGVTALRMGLKCLKEGAGLGLAVDGPRGPRGHVGPGVEFLATQAACVVRWVVVEVRPAIRLNTWDQFAIPLPFSRVRVVYGDIEPIDGQKDGAIVDQLEESLGSVSLPEASRGRFSRALTTAEASLGAPSRE